MKKIICLIFFFALPFVVFSSTKFSKIQDNISKSDNCSLTKSVGLIVDLSGIVKAYEKNDFRGFSIKDNNTKLYEGYVVKTFTNAEAKITLIDGTKIILTEKSSITFPSNKKVDVDNGTVYFKVTKREEIKGFLVSTKTATIGVKGTKFAVMQDNNSLNVFCKDGTIVVTSIKGEFKRYVEKEMDEYSEYLKRQYEDYTSYKEKLREEFIEYVKEIEMGAGKGITISDSNEVRDMEIPDNIDEMFVELDAF